MNRRRIQTSPSFELRMAHNHGSIGAGRIIMFPEGQHKKVPVIVPANTPDDGSIGTLTVRGTSLTDEGIYDGDQLVVTKRFTYADITPHRICAVLITTTGELVAKKIHYNIPAPGMVTLKSSGGDAQDIVCSPEDIQIQGIVYAMLRLADSRGSFDANGN